MGTAPLGGGAAGAAPPVEARARRSGADTVNGVVAAAGAVADDSEDEHCHATISRTDPHRWVLTSARFVFLGRCRSAVAGAIHLSAKADERGPLGRPQQVDASS
jgi:hypothetical protein